MHLKETHQHYFQIQGQLGISKLNYCWYFVYTHHGHFEEKIIFNKPFYDELLGNLKYFWYTFFAKHLIFTPSDIQDTSNKNNTIVSKPAKTLIKSTAVDKILPAIHMPPVPKIRTSRKRKAQNQNSSTLSKKPIYVCGVCKNNVLNVAKTFEDNSIFCESCKLWFHFKCANFNNKKDIPDGSWICKACN